MGTQFRIKLRVAQIALLTLGAQNLFAAKNYIVKLKDVGTQVQSLEPNVFSNIFISSELDNKIKKSKWQFLENLETAIVNVYSEHELDELYDDVNVDLIEEDHIIHAPNMSFAAFDDLNALEITAGLKNINTEAAWEKSYKGKGVKVLVLDTGIDKDHPDIKDNFIKGKNFVKTLKNNPLNSTPPPYDYFDDVGHGTHVAGTVAGAANGTGVVGVAPEAQIYAGKVCSPKGCPLSSIIAGLSWAIEENVDVINMSLGSQKSSKIEKMVIEEITKEGITIVASSGNDAAKIKNKIGFPAAFDDTISVGAVDSKFKRASFSQYGSKLDLVAPGVGVKSTVPKNSNPVFSFKVKIEGKSIQPGGRVAKGTPMNSKSPFKGSVLSLETGSKSDFYSQNLDIPGNILLFERSPSKDANDLIRTAQNMGATGVLIYNNVPGPFSLNVSKSKPRIPVLTITKSVGEALKRIIQSEKKVAAEINIRFTSFSAKNGTSMATPHVTGVVALLKSIDMKLQPSEIKSILKCTTIRLKDNPAEINGLGSGLIDASAAMDKTCLR